MGLTIRFQGGPRAGESLELDDERVLFGRGSECQVKFDRDMTKVSAQHCAIVKRLGEYVLELPSDHLVLRDGQQARDGERLSGTFDLQLGPGGPQLVVRVHAGEGSADTALPPTESQGSLGPGRDTLMEAQLGRTRRGLGVVVGSVLLLGGLGVVISRSLEETRHKADEAVATLGSMQGQVAAMGERMTLVESDLHGMSGTLGAAVQSALDETREAVRKADQRAMELAAPDLPALAKRVKESVYLVGLRTSDGQFRPVGTAWVVASGVLATNAHVARELEGRAGNTAIARSTAAKPRDHRLSVRAIHPGFSAFEELWNSIGFAGEPSAPPVLAASVGACDVALLEVVEGVQELAPALTLATAEELAGLDAGEEVLYAGFPMEGMAGGGVNTEAPEPQVQIGRLTALTDEFLVHQQDTALNVIVQHNLPAAGGASGSPVVDSRGRVIALLNAVNMHFVLEPSGKSGVPEVARLPAAVGVNFAQRVDLLRELQEQGVEAAQARRAERWRSQLEGLRRRLREARPAEPAPPPTGSESEEIEPILEVQVEELRKKLGDAYAPPHRLSGQPTRTAPIRLPNGNTFYGLEAEVAPSGPSVVLFAVLTQDRLPLDLLVVDRRTGASQRSAPGSTPAAVIWKVEGPLAPLALVVVGPKPGIGIELVGYRFDRVR